MLYKELKKQATQRRKPELQNDTPFFKEFETKISLKAVKHIFIDDEEFTVVKNMKELLKIMKAADFDYLEELVQASRPLFKIKDRFLYVIGASERDLLAVSSVCLKYMFVVCGPYTCCFSGHARLYCRSVCGEQ